jgi:hypothetical protein
MWIDYMPIELSEEQCRRLSMFFATQQKNKFIKFDIEEYPPEIKSYYDFYKNQGEDSLILEDDSFNVDLAVEKLFIVSTFDQYRFKYYRSATTSGINALLNFCKLHNKSFEVISGIVNYKNRIHASSRQLLSTWIMSNVKVDEKWIDLYFKKFWTSEEKALMLKHIIASGNKDYIELFWKSRAIKIKKELIKIADIKKLPFLLNEKNPELKKLIEKRMNDASS